MATTSLKHIRVDQVGSLVPDQGWRDAVERHQRGQATADDVRAAQDASIRAAIGRQEAIGLPVVTDGELRRLNFQESFGASVSGFDVPAQLQARFPAERGGASARSAPSRISRPSDRRSTRAGRWWSGCRLARNVPLEEYRSHARVANTPVKVTVLSADRISQRFA